MGCKDNWEEEEYSDSVAFDWLLHCHIFQFNFNNCNVNCNKFTAGRKRLSLVFFWKRKKIWTPNSQSVFYSSLMNGSCGIWTNREKSVLWTGNLQRELVTSGPESAEPQPQAVLYTIIRPIIMLTLKGGERNWERQWWWNIKFDNSGNSFAKTAWSQSSLPELCWLVMVGNECRKNKESEKNVGEIHLWHLISLCKIYLHIELFIRI